MSKTHEHGIVVGYHRDDPQRHWMIPVADTVAGRCVGCRTPVFLNTNGVSAVRERDAGVICVRCDKFEGVQVDRSLIES